MNIIYTDPWNVWTLLKPEKMQELAEQIANNQLEEGAIQATRWHGNRVIKINNYLIYYSGSNKKGQAGSGFKVVKKALKYNLGFEPLNERIRK
jgi:hypothetical protein